MKNAPLAGIYVTSPPAVCRRSVPSVRFASSHVAAGLCHNDPARTSTAIHRCMYDATVLVRSHRANSGAVSSSEFELSKLV